MDVHHIHERSLISSVSQHLVVWSRVRFNLIQVSRAEGVSLHDVCRWRQNLVTSGYVCRGLDLLQAAGHAELGMSNVMRVGLSVSDASN